MKKVIVSGKTIDEAVEKAINELQTTRDRLSYRVVQEPQKGFFGILGSKPAMIEAHLLPDPVDVAFQFLEQTVALMKVNATLTKDDAGEHIVFNLSSEEELGRLIGKRGQTLESLEYLTNLVANRQDGTYTRIELDAENYRERRRQTLEQLAERVAYKVKTTKERVSLEPMNALERKIIHTTLQRVEGVETVSEGKGLKRHVVIQPHQS
ncbi:RNA-binding cell elongation regulator Jag/EloR [Halalkalibacter oceani]|uniref:RNA-binding protein KhpB n=1 Tax=Halalkalibacter oceani TaxID=1653776 RepID=A0A9X2DV42_9BACI|nr:protein jag [Halalkalibacter oceani]